MRWISRTSEQAKRVVKTFTGEFNLRGSEMPGGYMGKIKYENDPRDAEIAKLKAQVQTIGESKMNSIVVNLGQGTTASFNKADICDLVSENVRLKAELEALRPKPVIEVKRYRLLTYNNSTIQDKDKTAWEETKYDGQLQITFESGKPVSAEVINQGEVK